MTISIQPLDSHGEFVGAPILTTWDEFLIANDGFDHLTKLDMWGILNMGAAYRLGGGAAGEYRIRRVGD